MKLVAMMPALLLLAALPAKAEVLTDSQIVTINDNAAWCWFQDERVLADKGKLLVSTVASAGGPGGAARSGNIEITTFEPYVDAPGFGGKSTVAVLHARLEEDDHDAAGLMVLPDGRYLAMYSKHMTDRIIRSRLSTRPGDATAWEPEQQIRREASVTYNNLFRLSDEGGRIYDFYRGEQYKPNFLTSDDNGKTWTYGNPVIRIASDPQNRMRPYARYASNSKDTIWFANTDAHPAEYPATSLYLAYIKGGKIYHPSGTELAALSEGVEPSKELCIFKGDRQNQAWVSQVRLDKDEKPHVAYTVHKTDADLRYRYYDGARGMDLELARAGSHLYKSQEHYTGNVTLDPANPRIIYFSTNVNPHTGEPLISKADGKRHWELYKAVLTFGRVDASPRGGGGTGVAIATRFVITPVTQDSAVDNIRPVVPAGDGSVKALLWMRGTYERYTRWNMAVVAAAIP